MLACYGSFVLVMTPVIFPGCIKYRRSPPLSELKCDKYKLDYGIDKCTRLFMSTKEQVGVEVREGEKGQTIYKCYIIYPETIFNNTILIKEKKRCC